MLEAAPGIYYNAADIETPRIWPGQVEDLPPSYHEICDENGFSPLHVSKLAADLQKSPPPVKQHDRLAPIIPPNQNRILSPMPRQTRVRQFVNTILPTDTLPKNEKVQNYINNLPNKNLILPNYTESQQIVSEIPFELATAVDSSTLRPKDKRIDAMDAVSSINHEYETPVPASSPVPPVKPKCSEKLRYLSNSVRSYSFKFTKTGRKSLNTQIRESQEQQARKMGLKIPKVAEESNNSTATSSFKTNSSIQPAVVVAPIDDNTTGQNTNPKINFKVRSPKSSEFTRVNSQNQHLWVLPKRKPVVEARFKHVPTNLTNSTQLEFSSEDAIYV